jgi:peroxiredoxin
VTLVPGQTLPDIRLHDGDGREVALAAFRGRPLLVVLIRYYG